MSSSKSSIRAGIVDNALVVSFMAADAPRVWRADMNQLLTAALEVQDNQGKSTLVMKRSGAPAEEIVTFSGRKDAIDALQVITEVLLQGTGQSTGGCTTAQPEKSCGWFKKLLKFLLKVVVAVFVFVVVTDIFFHIAGMHPPSHQAATANAPAAQPTGVPAPADSIIGK